MPTWPSDLPQQFERDGFSDSLADQLARPGLPGGPGAARRLAGRREGYPISGRMLMTTAQWNMLTAFWRDDLAYGALEFDFPDPDDATASIVAALSEPQSLDTIGGEFHSVTLSLERVA